jgi:hypothetical protein
MSNEKLEPYIDPNDIHYMDTGTPGYSVPIVNAVLRLRPVKEETSSTSNIEDLEVFMHRLLQAGIAYNDVSREGFNYAVSMMPPSLSPKESLDEASKLLEKATRNIGISADQLMQEQQEAERAIYRQQYEMKS